MARRKKIGSLPPDHQIFSEGVTILLGGLHRYLPDSGPVDLGPRPRVDDDEGLQEMLDIISREAAEAFGQGPISTSWDNEAD